MIETHFHKEEGYLHVIYAGEIDLAQIVNYINDLVVNENYPDVLRILTDASQASYTFKSEGRKEIKTLLQEVLSRKIAIRNAFIHGRPIETALSVLLENEKVFTNYSHKVFSTKRAALIWLFEK